MQGEKVATLAALVYKNLQHAELLGFIEVPSDESTVPAALVAWSRDSDVSPYGTHLAVFAEHGAHLTTGHYLMTDGSAPAALADLWDRAGRLGVVHA